MRCTYINLDRAADRRAALVSAFQGAAPSGWTLERFSAVDRPDMPGALSPAEKGCFLSHRQAIAAQLDDEEPILIVEDDVLFSPQTFAVAPGMLAPGLDLLFCNVAIGDPTMWVKLTRLRSELAAEGRFRTLDLSNLAFASASAYFINGASKRKVSTALAQFTSLDVPYDIALRRLVQGGQLTAATVFPFVTGYASTASQSQIMGGQSADVISLAFQQLMYVGRDTAACAAQAERIQASADEDARLAGMILAGVMSPATAQK